MTPTTDPRSPQADDDDDEVVVAVEKDLDTVLAEKVEAAIRSGDMIDLTKDSMDEGQVQATLAALEEDERLERAKALEALRGKRLAELRGQLVGGAGGLAASVQCRDGASGGWSASCTGVVVCIHRSGMCDMHLLACTTPAHLCAAGCVAYTR